MNAQLIELVRAKFSARLQAKTGWGRVEAMQAFDTAVSEAAIELLDQQPDTTQEKRPWNC
jgi:hypothetical protein